MREFTRFLIWYIVVAVSLAAFGLVLGAFKFSRQQHEILTGILGPHGFVFGLVLPLMMYAFIPILVIWIVARVVSTLRKSR